MNGVYVTRHWNWRGTDVFGAKPVICDGGLRYLDAQGKEQSAWVGGYNGPREKVGFGLYDFVAYHNTHTHAYMLNIEGLAWSIKSTEVGTTRAKANIERIADLLWTIRNRLTDRPILFYPTPPHREKGITDSYANWLARKQVGGFAWLLRQAQSISGMGPVAAYQRWQRANDDARGLIGYVDALTPSLYRMAVRQDESYIRLHMAEARRLARAGQRVLPTVCPVYHNLAGLGHDTPMPLDDWRSDLQAIRANGGRGVVIWSAKHEHVTADHVEIAQRIFGN